MKGIQLILHPPKCSALSNLLFLHLWPPLLWPRPTASLIIMWAQISCPPSLIKPLRIPPMGECRLRYHFSESSLSHHLFYLPRNYVDQATALAQNLTFASGNTLIMRADSRTTLSASGPGRNSVRIRSVKTYTTHAVVYVSI